MTLKEEVPKHLTHTVHDIKLYPEQIPIVHEKPDYRIIEKHVPYVLREEYPVEIKVPEVIIEKTEVPKVVEKLIEKVVVVK